MGSDKSQQYEADIEEEEKVKKNTKTLNFLLNFLLVA